AAPIPLLFVLVRRSIEQAFCQKRNGCFQHISGGRCGKVTKIRLHRRTNARAAQHHVAARQTARRGCSEFDNSSLARFAAERRAVSHTPTRQGGGSRYT